MFHGMHGRRGGHCGPRGHRGGGWGAFGGEWSFGGAERGGGGRGRRMFDGGELRLVLLKLIADEPRHGYELIRAIEELTGGDYAPSPGVVYPTLTLLEEMGFIEEQANEEKRKRYAATDEGRAHLEENREQAEALIERLTRVGERRQRTDGAPIRRAMGNLRVALEHRLARGEFSQDTLHDVAALIDEVAQKIERLR
ncbi:MAG: PadR family transcriptional regulator [Sphingomonas sp.]|uniref:PadR family transcriptional regulator n=1 Tax=Sphingomonas lycopersici TaxID=2951807 RepID=A0AA41Z7N4_9SPHN|nr:MULTISPECIES: PadR family transcriptional regulator [Sphingomonas]MBV8239136.1 PadR family transcriptional regulator [Sphingomonas sp.]MCW6529635.1 PadR family transcriptional regulator [Sphingomonas lycopersici]MCW6534443.1 PadR family transcriptional regulator [Sphingomonas lycopersici]OJU19997.1 MAG: PadR family transcriptional regulator [Sphingomonas sp. 66-10]